MGSADPEVIRDQYDAVNERDWERAMSHFAEDVELVVPDESIKRGVHRGREAVRRWFGDWIATFDRDLHFEITEIRELDDGSLLVVSDHHARGRASGVEVRMPVFWRYRLREGKVIWLRGFQSLADAVGASGDKEPPETENGD